MNSSTKSETLDYFEGVEKILDIYFFASRHEDQAEGRLKKNDVQDNSAERRVASVLSPPSLSLSSEAKGDTIDASKRHTPSGGLRLIPRSAWDKICEAGQCSILKLTSNKFCDSYILSESSLFVYMDRVIIKTCGRTTPIRCIPLLKAFAEKYSGMKIQRLRFQRKNYSFPDDQVGPHKSFDGEVARLTDAVSPLKGEAHVLGSRSGEHWCVFTAKSWTKHAAATTSKPTMHLIMYGLDSSKTQIFTSTTKNTAKSVAETLDLRTLVSNGKTSDQVVLDGFMFQPCGYSMNGLDSSDYFTIHITPESHCSYASLEAQCDASRFPGMIDSMLRSLHPSRFAVVVNAAENSSRVVDPAELVLRKYSMALACDHSGRVVKCTSTHSSGGCSMATFSLVKQQ